MTRTTTQTVTTNTSVTTNTTATTNTTLTSVVTTTPTTSQEDGKFLDYSTDYPDDVEMPCYFLQDILNASKEILSKRCQQRISGKVNIRRIFPSLPIGIFYLILFLLVLISFISFKLGDVCFRKTRSRYQRPSVGNLWKDTYH